jgi:hypothetical protein
MAKPVALITEGARGHWPGHRTSFARVGVAGWTYRLAGQRISGLRRVFSRVRYEETASDAVEAPGMDYAQRPEDGNS